MHPGYGVAAVLALPAGWRCAGAEEPLSQPEGEALLAHARRPLKQQAGGERLARDLPFKARAKGLMTDEWEKRHDPEKYIVRRSPGATIFAR